jgi:hypothetical protein
MISVLHEWIKALPDDELELLYDETSRDYAEMWSEYNSFDYWSDAEFSNFEQRLGYLSSLLAAIDAEWDRRSCQ